MTVTSVAVVTTEFLFGMCSCTGNNDVGTGDFLLVQGDFARVWTCAHAITRISGHGLICLGVHRS